MLSWKDFKKKSSGVGWGSRDRVELIDKIVEPYDTRKNDPNGNIVPSEHVSSLVQIVDACDTYLNDPERQKSNRRPAVQSLLITACQDLLLYAAMVDKLPEAQKAKALFDQHKSDTDSILGPKDDNGFGPIGASVMKNDSPNMVRFLIDLGDDPNQQASKRVPQGWTPLDIARTQIRPRVELLLMGEDGVKGQSKSKIRVREVPPRDAFVPRQVHGVSRTAAATVRAMQNCVPAVSLLSAATTSDPNNPRDLDAAYTTLYAQKLFRPILGIAAVKVIGARKGVDPTSALRIFATGEQHTGAILPGTPGAGLYMKENNTLDVAAKTSQKSMEGTLIHELTHHAAWVVFQNDVMPFDPMGSRGNEVDPTYLFAAFDDRELPGNQAKRDDVRYKGLGHADAIPGSDAEGGAYVTILGRCDGYANSGRTVAYAPFVCSLGMAFEFIVGIPQAIHLYGADQVKQTAPHLYAYFVNTFLARLETWLKNHNNYKYLCPKPLANALPYKPPTVRQDEREVWVRLRYKDPEGTERDFPEGLSVTVQLDDGRTVKETTDSKGRIWWKTRQTRFALSFDTPDTYFGVNRGVNEDTHLIPEAQRDQEIARGFLLFKLPATWSTRDSAWACTGFDANSHKVTIGADGKTKAAPIGMTLDPNWQYLKFVYFDRIRKQSMTLPRISVEGVFDGTESVNSDDGWVQQAVGPSIAADSVSNWTIGTADDLTQCLPWIVQSVPKPDKKSLVRFKQPKNSFIHTTSTTRTIVVADNTTLTNRIEKPCPERLQYYDLPELWHSYRYYARHTGLDGDYYQDIPTADKFKGSSGAPLVFSLDDIVLTDKDLAPIRINPTQERVAILANTFATGANLSDIGVYKPDDPAELSFFSKLEATKNYLSDYPGLPGGTLAWTRLVTAQGNLFDVFDKRTTGSNSAPCGARAAVCWVDSPAVAMPNNSVQNRPDATGPSTKIFVIQPFFFQEYDPVKNSETATQAAGPYAEPNDGHAIGRCDLALLRCCEAVGTDEIAVNLHYLRLKINGASPDYVNSGFKNVCARWNGSDAVNAAPTEILPVGPTPLKIRALWFLQGTKGPEAHYELTLSDGRANMNAKMGGGEWGATDNKPVMNRPPMPDNGFVAAHECGHSYALPDEYPEYANFFSYLARPIVANNPGDPYEPDRLAMMRGTVEIRTRYFWHAAEWIRSIANEDFKVKRGAEEYQILHHPKSPKRTYTYWPLAGEIDATLENGKFDLYLYRLGEDQYAKDLVPAETCDGILVVKVKMKLRFPDTMSEAEIRTAIQDIDRMLNSNLNRKWTVAGTVNGETFTRCLMYYSPRYIVENARNFSSDLVDRKRVHFTIDITEAGPTAWSNGGAYDLVVKRSELGQFQIPFARMLGKRSGLAGAIADNIPVRRVARKLIPDATRTRLPGGLPDLPRAEPR